MVIRTLWIGFERNPAVGEFGDFAIWVCVGLAVVGVCCEGKIFSRAMSRVAYA